MNIARTPLPQIWFLGGRWQSLKESGNFHLKTSSPATGVVQGNFIQDTSNSQEHRTDHQPSKHVLFPELVVSEAERFTSGFPGFNLTLSLSLSLILPKPILKRSVLWNPYSLNRGCSLKEIWTFGSCQNRSWAFLAFYDGILIREGRRKPACG